MKNLTERSNYEIGRKLTAGLIFTALVGVYILVTNRLILQVDRILAKSEGALGGRGNIWAVVIMIPVILGLLVSLVKVKFRPATSVGLLMLAFPLLGRVRNVLGVAIYRLSGPDGWVEYVGLTSLGIVVLFLVFRLRRVSMRRPDSKAFRIVEACLWLFAGLGTFAQLMHHEPMSAILLSFNGLWQYLLWFYVVTGAVRSTKDTLSLFAWFSGMLMINIVLRPLFTGVLYDPSWAAGGYFATRFYASGLGWASNYSILLAISVILNVGLLSEAKTQKARVVWLTFSALQMVELFFTFTRGAYITLAFSLLFLLAWPGTRRAAATVLAILTLGVLSALFVWGDMTKLVLGARIGIWQGDFGRWELLLSGISDVLHDWGLGFGIFKEPSYYVLSIKRELPAHNFFLVLVHAVGLWAALAWISAFLTSLSKLIKQLRYRAQNANSILGIILVVAILAWLFFENITGPGITGYFPVEATATIYTLIALTTTMSLISEESLS